MKTYSTHEIARILDVQPETVVYHCKQGHLHYTVVPGKRKRTKFMIIDDELLWEFLESKQRKPQPIIMPNGVEYMPNAITFEILETMKWVQSDSRPVPRPRIVSGYDYTGHGRLH